MISGFNSLLWRNIAFAKWKNIWLILTIALATALITGALILGSSVKMTLQEAADRRLGHVEAAIIPQNRWFGDALAQQVNARAQTVIHVAAFAYTEDSVPIEVNLYGVDDDFFSFVYGYPTAPFEAIANRTAREKLQGNDVVIRIPQGSSFAESLSWSLNDQEILGLSLSLQPYDSPLDFNPLDDRTSVANIFVPKSYLAERLDKQHKSNMMLLKGIKSDKPLFTKPLPLSDYGLRVKELPNDSYEISSEQTFISASLSEVLTHLPLKGEAVMSYFVNTVSAHGRKTPYSFITGSGNELKPNETNITQWLADDLNLKPGDSISIEYFDIQSQGELKSKTAELTVKNIIPTEDRRNLIPDFPGFSEEESCTDWDPSVPINQEAIRDKDEQYWKQYQASPKLFVSLETAQRLFGSPHGNLTSLRFAANPTEQAEKSLSEKEGMFTPIPLGANSEKGVEKSMDFSGLFLALSFFIIIAAIILLYLICRLNLDSRKQEISVLKSIGYSHHHLRTLLLREYLVYIFLGAAVGIAFSIGYVSGIIYLLNQLWSSISGGNIIQLYIDPLKLQMGFVISSTVCIITIFLVVRKVLMAPLKENFLVSFTKMPWDKRDRLAVLIYAVLTLACFVYVYAFDASGNIAFFFISAFLMLMLAFKLAKYLIVRFGQRQHFSLLSFAAKNNTRYMRRAMSIVVILSFGMFICLLAALNYRTMGNDRALDSGTGGFYGILQTAVPLKYDLNSEGGREEYKLNELPEDIRFTSFKTVAGASAGCLNLNRVTRPQLLGVTEGSLDGRFGLEDWSILQQEEKDSHVIPLIADAEVIQWSLGLKVGDVLDYEADNGEIYKLKIVAALNKSIFQGYALVSEENLLKMYPNLGGSQLQLVDFAAEGHIKQITNALERYGVTWMTTAERLNLFNSVQNTYIIIFFAMGTIGLLLATLGFALLIKHQLALRKQEFTLLYRTGYSVGNIFFIIATENLMLLLLAIASSLFALSGAAIPLITRGLANPPLPLMCLSVTAITLLGITIIFTIAHQSAKAISLAKSK